MKLPFYTLISDTDTGTSADIHLSFPAAVESAISSFDAYIGPGEHQLRRAFKIMLAVFEAEASMLTGKYVKKELWDNKAWEHFWERSYSWVGAGDYDLACKDLSFVMNGILGIDVWSIEMQYIEFNPLHVELVINAKNKKGRWNTDEHRKEITVGKVADALNIITKYEEDVSRMHYSSREYEQVVALLFIYENDDEAYPLLKPIYHKPIYHEKITIV